MIIRVIASAVALLISASCAEPVPSQLMDDSAAPQLLSETMLYSSISDRTVDERLVTYSPKFPLWSDGAAKDRWVFLPGAVESSDANHWVFPVGTMFFKEFAFNGRAVETRVMQKTSENPDLSSWVFSTYLWRADGSDAELVGEKGAADVAPTEFPGVAHNIPAQGQCRSCHMNGGDPVLGFGAVQLDGRRNEYIPHASIAAGDVTNEVLYQNKMLTQPVTHVQEDILDPVALAAVGYLHGNCGSCHSAGGVMNALGMDLSYDVNAKQLSDLPIYKTAVNVFATPSEVTEHSSTMYRIKAGDVEHSLLPKRIAARGEVLQMPPMATKVVDEDAVAIVRRWIEALAGKPAIER